MLPSRKDMLLPLLRGIMDGKMHSKGDLKEALKKHLGLSESDLKTGQVDYELGWAKTYLTKIGLARYPDTGLLQITEDGRRMVHCKNCPDRVCRQCVEALRVDPSLIDEQYLGSL